MNPSTWIQNPLPISEPVSIPVSVPPSEPVSILVSPTPPLIQFPDMLWKTQITYITLDGLTSIKSPITFGQVFVSWDVPSWYTLMAQDKSWKVIDIQVDKKTTYSDWSLWHAIISMLVDDSIDTWIAFYITNNKTQKQKETINDLINSWLTISVKLNMSWSLYEAKLDSLNMNKPIYQWLDWDIVNEWWYKVPFISQIDWQEHKQLMARINLRKYNWNNNIRVDYVIENNWVYWPDAKSIVYDAELFFKIKIYFLLNIIGIVFINIFKSSIKLQFSI